MNIFIFIMFNLTIVFSLRPDKTRFCYTCKHFIDSKNGIEFGRCAAFPRIDNDYTNYLVSGKRDMYIIDDNYYYCGTARSNSDMCGQDGSLYRIKYPKSLGNTPDDDNNKKMK